MLINFFLSDIFFLTLSSTFAWKIPWTEEPGGLQSMGLLESDTTERLHFHFSLEEGENNPLWGGQDRHKNDLEVKKAI